MAILAVKPAIIFQGAATGVVLDAAVADAFRRGAFQVGYGDTADIDVDTANLWFHARVRLSDENATSTVRNILEISDTTRLHAILRKTDAGQIEFRVYDGSYTSLAGTYAFSNVDETEVTLDVFCGSDGTFELYVDGELEIDTSGGAPAGNYQTVRFRSAEGTFAAAEHEARWSEIIVADASTVGARLAELTPNGEGTEQDNTAGAYTDVDEWGADAQDVEIPLSSRYAVRLSDAPATGLAVDSIHAAFRLSSAVTDHPNVYIRQAAGIVDAVAVAPHTGTYYSAFDTDEVPSEVGIQTDEAADLQVITAAIVYFPAVGTARTDLLAQLADLPVSAVTETGTTLQGDLPADRDDSELTTGELTTQTAITLTWSSGPSLAQQVEAARRLPSPRFAITHA